MSEVLLILYNSIIWTCHHYISLAASNICNFYFCVRSGSNVFSTTLLFYSVFNIFNFIFSNSYFLSFKKFSINFAYYYKLFIYLLFFDFSLFSFYNTSLKTCLLFFYFAKFNAIDLLYLSNMSHRSLSLSRVLFSDFYILSSSKSASSLTIKCLLSVYVHIKFIKLRFSAWF